MGIFLYARHTATSLHYMSCDAFQPFDEAVCTPETLQLIPMKGKSKHFINAKRQDLSAQQATFKTNVNISSECLQASYAISLHVVKCKTPHNAVEQFMVL
jgi:hypothetical protein